MSVPELRIPRRRMLLSAVAATLLLAGCSVSNPLPPPSPPPAAPVPPGWTMTRVPSIDYGDYTMAQASSWCEGTTRVHVVVAFGVVGSEQGSHLAQDIELNAASCIPGATTR